MEVRWRSGTRCRAETTLADDPGVRIIRPMRSPPFLPLATMPVVGGIVPPTATPANVAA